MRGLISLKRNQTVRYANLELEPSTVAAMEKSPEGKYIWTVTLDHRLKAWNTQTGKAVKSTDILSERELDDGKKQPKYVMSAEQGTLLQLISPARPKTSKSVAKVDQAGTYCLVAYSPKDHQFKYYGVSHSRITRRRGEYRAERFATEAGN